ncbi:RNA polymerase sigma factor [Primorskyibacter sp. S187A]|uniref:RNA polymerase sigma factor n=1 Tax=Primorskyibacter sp. S187A TaxID=3415130 RepID=UPI003C7B267E
MRDKVSEDALAQAAAGGDAAAFGALAARCYDRTFALAFRLTGSRAEAEDLAQDIFESLPGKLPRYDARARFSTWLYRVTVNAAQDRRRRAQSYARASEGWGDVELSRRAEAEESAAALDWLTRAMAALPDDLRETAVLVLEPLTQGEVAEILGVSEGTVAWRMSEVKKRLRALKEAEQ